MEEQNLFPGMVNFTNKVLDDGKSDNRQFTDIFNATINLFEFSLQMFSVLTIRTYEDRLIKESEIYRKKTKPINEILRNKFVAPSLGTHSNLARACFHLVDETAPLELIKAKEKLNESILMGNIGTYLNDLTDIFDAVEEIKEGKPKVINREISKRPLLTIINDFIAFRNSSSHLVNIGNLIEDAHLKQKLSIEVWRNAFKSLINHLSPLLAYTYDLKIIDKIFSEGVTKMIAVRTITFNLGDITESEENIELEDWYENQWNERYEVLLTESSGKKKSIDLFPFILLKAKKIYFYKKTKASGYQYFSIADDKTFTVPSKKKFNRTVFKTSSSANSQALFWADVLPKYNPQNKVKANIPTQGITQFIGRKRQINKIREEIIEIPNENGILYGPGGVGKTALLIQLSEQLFNQSDPESVLYNNIIWVSAKLNFYHWEQNATITNPQQFESLENVLQIILRFFDYEDVNEYDLDELKELFLELVEEHKVLLVLDNFETVLKAETNKILSFFGTDVKKRLKHFPTHFKVILTSRELVPSGYYQIKLDGLDLRESKLLIESIYERYKNSLAPLTAEQCKLIHDATSGIPIVIKHCLGQIYEFQVSLGQILHGLSEEFNEVIKFSYSEILSHLKKDECYLHILLLLEILNEPISARQMGVILERPINDINKHLPTLLNFQCVDKINIGIEEKYKVSTQVGLLVKSLINDNSDTTSHIRSNIAKNLTLEKKMDYVVEEFEITEIFHSYLENRDFTYAEYFLKSEINKRPGSHLLRYHYALYLRDRKNDFIQAIKILEELDNEIVKTHKRDANVLLALALTYTLLDFPDYNSAYKCCQDLLHISETKPIILFTAEFLINWSSYLKNKRELDPIKAILKKSQIRELANEGIKLITMSKPEGNTHKYLHLIAQGYFNQWETEKAKLYLIKAMELAQDDLVCFYKYEKFKSQLENYLANT